jgi:uncharacterized repeat protein (TIGR01451 family)
MKYKASTIFALAVGLFVLTTAVVRAEEHFATRLGNPATRFAPTMHTPDDLRARFRDPKLAPDIAAILRQWGWTGNLNDLRAAAATAEISDVKIPVGTVMPFMSSREGGKPVCLRNVHWVGKEPVSAYAFNFTSNGRRYRCVTPKPCSNFFLEDLGPEPKAELALDCSAPEAIPAGRPVRVCLTLQNTGDGAAAKSTLTLPVPAGVTVLGASEGAVTNTDRITWEVADLAPNTGKQLCAYFIAAQPGTLAFNSTATRAPGQPLHSECSTRIFGINAILVEVVDLADPIEVGKEVTYVITVTNQGKTPATNVRVVCTLPASQDYVSGSGDTTVSDADRTITMAPLPTLAGKAVATWQVVTKATAVADSRFKLEVVTDQFEKPITREESTQLY